MRLEDMPTLEGECERRGISLSAANERIRELEALEQQRVESLSAAYVTIAKVSEQLTAERAISDKLEKALAFFIEWGHCAAANDKARTALAEVAALRNKEQK